MFAYFGPARGMLPPRLFLFLYISIFLLLSCSFFTPFSLLFSFFLSFIFFIFYLFFSPLSFSLFISPFFFLSFFLFFLYNIRSTKPVNYILYTNVFNTCDQTTCIYVDDGFDCDINPSIFTIQLKCLIKKH